MFFFLFIFSLNVWSASFCPEKNWTEDIARIKKSLIDGIEDSRNYFTNACRLDRADEGSLASIEIQNAFAYKPPSQGLNTNVPFSDLQGKKTQDLLRLLVNKIKQKHKLNSDFSFLMRQCTYQGKSQNTYACQPMNQWLKNDLSEMVQLARFNLALAHPTDEHSFFSDSAETKLNFRLHALKSFKEKKWQELSPQEYRMANQAFNQIKQEVETQYRGKKSSQDLTNKREDLLGIRHMHYMIYLSVMGMNPILQYIQSANPSPQEISQAAQQVGKNLEREKKLIDELEAKINKVSHHGRAGVQSLDPDVLKLINYQADFEEVLLENPQYCGIALSLKQIQANRSTTEAIAGLPILAASFFVPPMAGLGLGLTTSAYYYYQTKAEIKERKESTLSRVQNPGMAAFKNQLYNDYSDLNTDEIRQAMQNDVTQIYRQEVQGIRQLQVENRVNLVAVPVMMGLPGLSRMVRSQVLKMTQVLGKK